MEPDETKNETDVETFYVIVVTRPGERTTPEMEFGSAAGFTHRI